MKQNILTALEIIGLLLIAAGIVIPIFTMDIHSIVFKLIFTVGAVAVFMSRLLSPYKGNNTRLKRLHRIEIWGSLFFCVAAFFMFYNQPPSLRDSIAFVLAGGVVQIYTSIMIPRVAKKAEN